MIVFAVGGGVVVDVGVAVGVVLGVDVGEGVFVGVEVMVVEGVGDFDGLALGTGVEVTVAVGIAVCVGLGVGVGVLESTVINTVSCALRPPRSTITLARYVPPTL